MTQRLQLRNINEMVAEQIRSSMHALKEELKAEILKVVSEQIKEIRASEETVIEICDNCGAEVDEDGVCECPVEPPEEDRVDSDYHQLTECFVGDLTQNYANDYDFTRVYAACQMKGEHGSNTCDKAYNDARKRVNEYYDNLAKENDAPTVQHSYFHALKTKLVDMSGIKQKIEALLPAIQKAEIYMHGTDLTSFKAAMKEMREIIN